MSILSREDYYASQLALQYLILDKDDEGYTQGVSAQQTPPNLLVLHNGSRAWPT